MTRDTGPSGAVRAFDSLEIGPVRLEARRLRCPYTVIRGRRTESTELVCRWEEDVLVPSEPASENLAAMVAAQVALNYGLFCDAIVLRGPFDSVDRRFLETMARNTAREIWANKLIADNPFLRGEAATLSPTPLQEYLRAELQFPDPEPAGALPRWDTEARRHAVLSSGGKDSLLSFGLLREIGVETHPIFINESGRHWFTALNAYRHLRETYAGTARVWTNADRVFNWMLRRLPFVRPDFARVRADIYPIRLWTVAVFLFGALPLLRRRGIGRLVIGDEYDTTVRANRDGIPHYDGLYDQSLFFDRALSRYLARKRYSVSQFSVLRPLSEMLIEKTLVERYPELLRQQVSCHATHLEGERVRPCGRCEKCRRIVGMLIALGADPSVCGYTKTQVADCLRAIANHGVHQEPPGVQHLLHLLAEAGHLPCEAAATKGARARPELLKLRIDAARSPLDAVPQDLRLPLLAILLRHAEGAVRRQGRVWVEFDPLAAPELHGPYAFERPGARGDDDAEASGSAAASGKRGYLLGELTWPEARTRLKEVDLALLPVGAIEQHGRHLPLDTDAFDAERLAREVAAACSDPLPLVLPTLPYGVSYHHEDFSGTIAISSDVLARLVFDIGISAARNGIAKLVIVNGHGGNTPALQLAAQKINCEAHIFTCVDTGETSDADIAQLCETPNDVHAGEIETSTALANRPALVQMGKARRFVPRFSSRYLNFSSRRSVEWYARTARISKHGVLGDPTRATRDKGEQMWAVMVRNLLELVEDLKGMTLDEIYEKRY